VLKGGRGWVGLLASAIAIAPCVHAAAAPQGVVEVAARGGDATFSLNPDALAALGLGIAQVERPLRHLGGKAGVSYETIEFGASDASTIGVRATDGAIAAFGGGALRHAGGFVLSARGQLADLRGFGIRASRRGGLRVEVVDAAGTAWLDADQAHYDVTIHEPAQLSVRQMDLRVAPRLAALLGRREFAGRILGTLAFRARLAPEDAAAIAGGVCDAPLPRPGLVTNVVLSHSNLSGFWDSIYVPRCGLPPLPDGGACTATSTNGKVVVAADASLRNAGETGIPWHAHFGGEHPPYGNDQHPYLVWNLYRVDRDGALRQIGASGAKHAFYSINEHCRCSGGNVFWPGCEDVYSASSNDNGSGEQNLAPRAEIVPFTGVWARCGSSWDRDCDGRMDADGGARDLFAHRMLVDESDLLPPLADGARYWFEYWYVVRDDADVYDTMGYREVRPRKVGADWRIELVGADLPGRDFFLGPALNRWVDPAREDRTHVHRELATPLGRARVAATVRDLGGGRWRYRYALMNVDYAEARFDPARAGSPYPRLLESHGFAGFEVPLARGATVESVAFAAASKEPRTRWTASAARGVLAWSAPPEATLEWGMLDAFEFIADRPPRRAKLVVRGRAAGAHYEIESLAPR